MLYTGDGGKKSQAQLSGAQVLYRRIAIIAASVACCGRNDRRMRLSPANLPCGVDSYGGL